MILRLTTLAALLLLVFRLAWVGTRRPAPSKGVVEIELCVWGMPFENDLYTKVYIPEFERQNPGIKVRFHHFEDYANRVLLSHAGGIAPDVIREGSSGNMIWTRRGLNLPLNRFIDGPDGIDRRDFIPLLWEPLTYRGETYAVPQDINIVGLFYNKDIFDRAGMKYPDASWTWADLKRAVDALTIPGEGGEPKQKGLDMAWGGGSFQPFLYQAGGRMWEGDRAAFATRETVEALEFYRSLMKTYTLTRSNQNRGGLGADKFFASGRVAMYVDGSWMAPSLTKNSPNLRFGIAPLPRGAKPMSVSGSCSWGIDSNTRHPEEAWKLVKFLSSTWALNQYWQVLWVAPPARWSSLRSPEFRSVGDIRDPKVFHERCDWIPLVLERGWTTMEGTSPYAEIAAVHFNEAIDKVLLEHADPMASLQEAARRVDAQIAATKRGEQG